MRGRIRPIVSVGVRLARDAQLRGGWGARRGPDAAEHLVISWEGTARSPENCYTLVESVWRGRAGRGDQRHGSADLSAGAVPYHQFRDLTGGCVRLRAAQMRPVQR